MDTQPTENRWHGAGFGNQAESAPSNRRRWWHVDCRDVANTHRDLDVLVNRNKVILVGPPDHASEQGKAAAQYAAELSTRGAGQLSMALRDAAAQARK